MGLYKVFCREVAPGTTGGPNLAGTSITGSPKITTNSVIRYYVKLYKDDGTAYTAGVTNAAVNITWDIAADKPSNLSWNKSFVKSGGAFGINPDNNWYSDIKGKGPSTINPTFTVIVEGTEFTLSGAIPSPSFTLNPVSKLPTIPAKIHTDLSATGVLSTSADVYYSPCSGQTQNVWAALIIKYNSAGTFNSSTIFNYTYTIKFYNKDGSAGKADISFGTDYILRESGSKATAYSKAQQWLLDFKTGVFCSSLSKAANNPGGSNKDTTLTTPRWNPPNHKYTRGDSLIETIENGGMTDKNARLAYMFSDYTYKNNTQMSATKQYPKYQDAKWGFRFMYNPTNLSYSVDSSTVNPELLSNLTNVQLNMVSGNSVIEVSFILNRQLDMQLLDPANKERVNWKSYYLDDPIRGYIDNDVLNRIFTRGTEYDLEFFYRIIGFEPTATALLQNKEITSDQGFITKQPFWFRVHDNLTYYVSLMGMSVNHVAFTKNMVPYLTEVKFTMNRVSNPTIDISKVNKKKIKPTGSVPHGAMNPNMFGP